MEISHKAKIYECIAFYHLRDGEKSVKYLAKFTIKNQKLYLAKEGYDRINEPLNAVLRNTCKKVSLTVKGRTTSQQLKASTDQANI